MIDFKLAKEHLDLGLAVFPVKVYWSEQKKKFEKLPMVEWRAYQKRLPTLEELHTWFDKPQYNAIGCTTGRLSGIMAIDIDDPKLFDKFPSSVVSETISGHQQHIFKWTREIRNLEAINGEALDFRGDGGLIVLPDSSCDGKSYKWLKKDFASLTSLPQDFLDLIAESEKKASEPFDHKTAFGAKIGQRNEVLKRAIASLLNKHDKETAWMYTVALNNSFPDPLDPKELSKKFDYIDGFVKKNPLQPKSGGLISHNSLISHMEKEKKWPSPPSNEVFSGLAGEIVNMIIPNSEVDPVAILLNFLIAFGSVIGRKPHFVVGATIHHMNEFGIIVGKTSKARKGMAWDYIERLFREIDPTWKHPSGLSSGEGIINYVRDPIVKSKLNKKTGKVEELIEDEGVSDKRVLFIESEFGRILSVKNRENATLSYILQDSWDGKNLATITKNLLQATEPHVSVLAHVTLDELIRRLHESEAYSGFGNRFTLICVQRIKVVPNPRINELEFGAMVQKVQQVVDFASTVDEIRRSPEAEKFWDDWYTANSLKESVGIIGAISDRDEAHVLRYSCLYALADMKRVVEIPHIKSAISLWEYSERSIAHIFQHTTGNPLADNIYQLLLEEPRTRDQIINYYQRHKTSAQISTALDQLKSLGKADFIKETTGGRPVEKWFFVSTGEESDISEKSRIEENQTISTDNESQKITLDKTPNNNLSNDNISIKKTISEELDELLPF